MLSGGGAGSRTRVLNKSNITSFTRLVSYKNSDKHLPGAPPSLSYGPNLEKPLDHLLSVEIQRRNSLWISRLSSFPVITQLVRNQMQRYRLRLKVECFYCATLTQPCTSYLQYLVDTNSPPKLKRTL